jgi:hypothetical protein
MSARQFTEMCCCRDTIPWPAMKFPASNCWLASTITKKRIAIEDVVESAPWLFLGQQRCPSGSSDRAVPTTEGIRHRVVDESKKTFMGVGAVLGFGLEVCGNSAGGP